MRDLDLEQRTREGLRAALSNARDGSSEAALARLLGLDRQTTHAYARGMQTPRLDVAVQIAEALGLTLEQLAGRERLPNRSPDMAQILWTLREVAEVQEGLGKQLQDVASQLALAQGQADEGMGTG